MFYKKFILILIILKSTYSFSAHVTGLSALYKSGQVFCTWNNLSNPGIEYRLYRSSSPILHGNQLQFCDYMGKVGANSSLNGHLSEIKGQLLFLKIDATAAFLDSETGLFVITSEQGGNFYYAVTVAHNAQEDTSIVVGENSLAFPVTESIERPLPIYQLTTTAGLHDYDVYVLFTTSTSTSLFPRMINVASFPFNFAVYPNGTDAPHPVTIRLSGGGSNFLSGVTANVEPNEYRISLDDWLPNHEHSSWFGFNEAYDILSSDNTPPASGINYDYALARLQFTIDWAIHHLPVDSNSVYFSSVSAGGAGALLSSLIYSSKIAAASLNVPKFDLSFLNDPDTSNNYNEGKPGRLKIDTLLGTVATNLPTNLGPATYDITNGGWLAHQHANDNIPLLFAVSGRHDTMVGWAEKIPYYDSVNVNRLGGVYYWDNRKHNEQGQQWLFFPDLLRYHRNVSFPAFSNCSINNDPGNGDISTGDTLGTINGFLDWNDTIIDEIDKYEITLFMHHLLTVSTTIPAPDSCFTDITLRRLQHFSVPAGALIEVENRHNGQLVQEASFLYFNGLITIPAMKIFHDTSVITVTYSIPTGTTPIPRPLSVSVYPSPCDGTFSVGLPENDSLPVTLELSDLSGRLIAREQYTSRTGIIVFSGKNKIPDGVYVLRILSGSKLYGPQLVVVKT